MKTSILLLILFLSILASAFFIYKIVQNSQHGSISNISQDQKIDDFVSKMSLREKILSLIIFHSPGTDTTNLASFVKKYKPAGVILMGDNIPGDLNVLNQITDILQQASLYPLLIAIDEEGCSVKRLPNDNLPCAADLQNASSSEVSQTYQKRSELLKSYGINLNFGTIADVTSNPDSFIYPRVFGGNPQIVGTSVAAAVNGARGFTFSTLKHFPGHGETVDDSHIMIPEVSISKTQWENLDAIPFEEGINAGTEFVMLGHINYINIDNNPASLSAKWHDILRNDLNFQGIMITDDMIMLQKSKLPEYQDAVSNAVDAINAGNDILLYVNDFSSGHEPSYHIDIEALVNGIEQAVKQNKIKESRINSSVKKVLLMREKINSLN